MAARLGPDVGREERQQKKRPGVVQRFFPCARARASVCECVCVCVCVGPFCVRRGGCLDRGGQETDRR